MAEGAVDALVVGGGIVGISCALSAQERGLTVLLCDPGEARRRASYGNAGCISRSSLFPMSGPGLWKNLPNYLLNRDPGLALALCEASPHRALDLGFHEGREHARVATGGDRARSPDEPRL